MRQEVGKIKTTSTPVAGKVFQKTHHSFHDS